MFQIDICDLNHEIRRTDENGKAEKIVKIKQASRFVALYHMEDCRRDFQYLSSRFLSERSTPSG